MQVSLNSSEGLKRQLSVTVPADRVLEAYNKKFNSVKQNAKIDGFRPGKVPQSVVESRFGESIHQEVVSELMQETLFEAMKEQDLNPAGMPNITELKADKGQEMQYVAEFEVYPEIELKDLNGVAVEKADAELTDADIDKVLENLRKQHANWKDVERACKLEDQVTIDFDGSCEGEAIQGGKAEDVPLVLGSGNMIPGFEDGIVGMKAGDEKDIEVTFPEQYQADHLAGKKAVFKIKIHKVEEPELPALDDALAEKFGIKEGGIEALKNDMRKHMGVEMENGLKVINKNAVMDKLLEANNVDVPEALIEQEMQHLFAQSQQQLPEDKRQKMPDEAKQYLRAPAERRVTLGLLVAEVIKAKQLKADEDSVKAMLLRMAGSYENPEEFVRWYMTDKERMAQVEAVVLEDQVVDVLLQDADVKDKMMSYEELVQAQQQAA